MSFPTVRTSRKQQIYGDNYTDPATGKIRSSWTDYYNINIMTAIADYAPFNDRNLYQNNAIQTRLSWLGKERDKESGLGDHGVRKYDNISGRFLSIDPLWEKYLSWTPYQYSGNNPVNAYDVDGRAVNTATAAAGFVIGTAIEYGSQITNNLITSKANNLQDMIWNACVRDIDRSDILVSGATGMIAGATFGVSAYVSITTNIGVSVAEDYVKSQIGSKTEGYGLSDVGASVLGATTGEVVGNMVMASKQASKQAGILRADAERATKLANQRGRAAQHQKAKQLRNKAANYGSLESILGGDSVDEGVSSGMNWIFKKDEDNK